MSEKKSVGGHKGNQYTGVEGFQISEKVESINTTAEAAKYAGASRDFKSQLSSYDRSILALKLESLIKEKARENLKLSDGKGMQKSANPVHTRKEIARPPG